MLILFFIFSSIFLKRSFADFILPGQKIIERCVKIDNLHFFPDIILIVLERGPLIKEINGYRIYQIGEDRCLEREYKMNKISIYWNTKGNLKVEEDKILLEDVGLNYLVVDEGNPLIEEEIIYSLTRTDEGRIKLYKSKETKKYTNGKIETINYNNPFNRKLSTPTLTPLLTQKQLPTNKEIRTINNNILLKKKESFLIKVLCWFKKLFGAECQ